MQKALSFLKPYSLLAGIALILMLTELAVELMQPLLIAKIIDDGILKQDLRHVWIWGTVMIGLTVLSFAAGMLNSFMPPMSAKAFPMIREKGFFKNPVLLLFHIWTVFVLFLYYKADKRRHTGSKYDFYEFAVYAAGSLNDCRRHCAVACR